MDKSTKDRRADAKIAAILNGSLTGEKRSRKKTQIQKNNVPIESQGPTDWSHHGLRKKYRGEKEREDAWQLYNESIKYSKTALLEKNLVEPVVKIERHPIYKLFYHHLENENAQSLARTRSRLLMKRFVFDVQEVWLSNLQHLREHQPKYIANAEQENTEDYQRGNGVANRRDVKAIQNLEHQIPSVSTKRVFANAYQTGKLPPNQAVLDYKTHNPPLLLPFKPRKCEIQPLVMEVRVQEVKNQYHLLPAQSINAVDGDGSNLLLHIERFLPSRDFVEQKVMEDNAWRVTIINQQTLETDTYLNFESNISSIVASIIMSESAVNQPVATSHRRSVEVFATSEFIALPFIDRTVEWRGKISINISTENISRSNISGIIPLSIQIHALLLPMHHQPEREDEQQLTLQSTPAEVQYLLQSLSRTLPQAVHRSAQLFDWEYWTAPDRVEDSWTPLLQCIALEADMQLTIAMNSLLRIPTNLLLQPPPTAENTAQMHQTDKQQQQQQVEVEVEEQQESKKKARKKAAVVSAVERVRRLEGTLTLMEALSCAYEILCHLSLEHSSTSSVPRILFPRAEAERDYFRKVDRDISAQQREKAEVLLAEEYLKALTVARNRPEETRPDGKVSKSSLQQMQHPWVESAKLYLRCALWEKLLDLDYCLSVEAADLHAKRLLVPGMTEFGRRGLWFPDALHPECERTQTALHFFRAPYYSSTNTIFVNSILALESNIFVPLTLAWESFFTRPANTPAEEMHQLRTITLSCKLPETLSVLSERESLQSAIMQRTSEVVLIFANTAVEGIDYLPRDVLHRPAGLRRYAPVINEKGFREQVEVELLSIDAVVHGLVFGVTRLGALPNNTAVNNRNIWHNAIAITEHINRPRNCKDYHYILANAHHRGTNQPVSYTTRMRALEMVGLTSSAFKDFEDNYQQIQQLRDTFNKQLALQAKIQFIEDQIEQKHNYLRRQIQDQLQRKLEKRMKKATKSEKGWRARYQASTLLELQGNWERRRDDRTGLIFFHQIPAPSAGAGQRQEKYMESCQWEVPASWDGDLWVDQLDQQSAGAGAVGSNLFGSSAFQPERSQDSAVGWGSSQVQREVGQQQRAFAGQSVHRANEHSQSAADAGKQVFNRQEMPAIGATVAHGAFNEPSGSWFPSLADSAHPHPVGGGGGVGGGRRGSADSSVVSDLDSVHAEKSLAESIAATIDTVNLEHIAEQLVSSDELMRVLAKRLGLPAEQVVPADELSSVFSELSSKVVRSSMFPGPDGKNNNSKNRPNHPYFPLDENELATGGRLKAPRGAPAGDGVEESFEPEFDSDDDLWSDDDHEVGDFDQLKELGPDNTLPSDQFEAAEMKRRELKEIYGIGAEKDRAGRRRPQNHELASVPPDIPYLHLEEVHSGEFTGGDAAWNNRYGWRRLPRPLLSSHFLASALQTHVKGPDATSCNTVNTPVYLTPIAPVDACKYVPENFNFHVETIFVPNVRKDVERAVATVERNIRREEELAKNVASDDMLLFGEAREFTSVEQFFAKQYKADKTAATNPVEAAQERAILAAKASNLAEMEDALAEEIPINTADDHGNSLFILAAQQGSRRMCKFLLRRGANINMQNLAGNTALHYCYAYSHFSLGEYLKKKGADDSLLNVDGLTCYEGLNRDDLNKMYGDYTEEDYQLSNEQESDSGEENQSPMKLRPFDRSTLSSMSSSTARSNSTANSPVKKKSPSKRASYSRLTTLDEKSYENDNQDNHSAFEA